MTADDAGQVAVVQGSAVTPMQMLQIAVSKGADLAQLEKLMELQERWEKNEARKAYNSAFAAFKSEAVVVIKNVPITDGPLKGKKYADLFGAVDAATPMLSKHGLAATWKITKDEKDWIEVTCTLTHVDGHSESASFGGPPDSGGAKNAMQARASTLSYVQRYTFLAVTGLAAGGTDDDGNGGGRFAEGVSPDRRQQIQKTASRMKAHLASGAIDDAVVEGEQSDTDGPEEWSFLWSFFDSKQRAAMKKSSAKLREERATAPITDAQRKRLEARISELKADREEIKAFCLKRFGKSHFADLSKADYTALDLHLDGLEQLTPSDPADSQPRPAGEAAEASAELVSPEQALKLEAMCNENGIPLEDFKEACGVERISQLEAARFNKATRWIMLQISNNKPGAVAQ